MHPTPEQTQAIRDYFEWNRDRAGRYPNPLFAGRDVELNTILDQAEMLGRSDVPEPNMTAVLYGAPGAGKSEILVQLKAALNATESENPPLVIDADGDMLMDASALITALYEAVSEPIRNHLGGRGWTLDGVSVTFGPVGVSARREPTRPQPTGTALLKGFARHLREANGGVAPMVVLLVDEAQAALAKAARHLDAQYALQLHLGQTGLKVLTVYGGLGNTPDALADCDVSRSGDTMKFPLRRLENPTVRSITVEGLAATTGQALHVIDEWADAIVAYSDGWPAHMNTAIRAVADRARANDWHLDRGGFNAAMALAGERRREYYNDRLKRCTSLQPDQFSAWAGMFDGRTFVTEGTIGASLKIGASEAGVLTRKAVHAGLLEQRDPGSYIAPIPSMVAHIAALGQVHDAKPKPRGQVR